MSGQTERARPRRGELGPRVMRTKAGAFVITGRPAPGDPRHPDCGWALPPGSKETWGVISKEKWKR